MLFAPLTPISRDKSLFVRSDTPNDRRNSSTFSNASKSSGDVSLLNSPIDLVLPPFENLFDSLLDVQVVYETQYLYVVSIYGCPSGFVLQTFLPPSLKRRRTVSGQFCRFRNSYFNMYIMLNRRNRHYPRSFLVRSVPVRSSTKHK